MGVNLQRAQVLFEQFRLDLAEKELRLELTVEPDNPLAHALLALCLAQREAYDEAQAESEQAIHLAPDLAFPHYVRASVLRERENRREAHLSLAEAVRIDPGRPDHFALLALLRLDERNWKAAVEASEKGLALDTEHVR